MFRVLIIFLLFTTLLFSNDYLSKVENIYFSFETVEYENLIQEIKKTNISDEERYYFLGVLYHNYGKIVYNQDPDLATENFENALYFFEELSNMQEDPEYLALLSSTYGKLSSLKPFSAIYWGIKAKRTIIKANELDSNNHKVFLIAATHLMHTPKSFGGDKAEAEALLKKSLKLNNDYKQNRINWANDAEIYAYLAQLEILRTNINQAEKFIKKSLMLEPRYGFVLEDLSSQLSKLKEEISQE